jgi:hypothetical protein
LIQDKREEFAMRLFRTNAIAVALVFFELLAPKAMAAKLTLKPYGKSHRCEKTGDLWSCFKVPEAGTVDVFSNEQMEAIKKAPEPTMEQIETTKKMLEVPNSTKQ